MEINWKPILRKPLLNLYAKKCKRLVKKLDKEPNRFSLQWRLDTLSKFSSKTMNSFNIKLKVTGYENLGKVGPALLVGNHQDLSDAFILIKALSKQSYEKDNNNKIPTFIAKHSLKYTDLSRYPLEFINVFFLERENLRKSLEIYKEFGKFIKNNKTYGVIFPEGTRNKVGSISNFKPGSLKIAQKELIPIIPFTINNSVGGFNWRRKEYLNVEIIFHKKILPTSFINQSSQALAERIQKIVESSFIPPSHEFIELTESSIIKFKKKEEKYLTNELKLIKKEEKIKAKLEANKLRNKNQEELETKKFINNEKKKLEKKQKNEIEH